RRRARCFGNSHFVVITCACVRAFIRRFAVTGRTAFTMQLSVILFHAASDLWPSVTRALTGAGCLVTGVRSVAELMIACGRCRPAAAIIQDLQEPPWQSAAAAVGQVVPSIAMILMASRSSEGLAIEALRAGFDDYVSGGDADGILGALRRYRSGARRVRSRAPSHHEPVKSALLGTSLGMKSIRDRVHQLSLADSNVLITGETGTGKELVAELIHTGSARRSRPFVSVNCAAVPDSLLESELFGYERGAFTGADTATAGKLESADGGT